MIREQFSFGETEQTRPMYPSVSHHYYLASYAVLAVLKKVVKDPSKPGTYFLFSSLFLFLCSHLLGLDNYDKYEIDIMWREFFKKVTRSKILSKLNRSRKEAVTRVMFPAISTELHL